MTMKSNRMVGGDDGASGAAAGVVANTASCRALARLRACGERTFVTERE